MTRKQILEGNQLIAEFMGGVLHKDWTNQIYTFPLDTFVFPIENTPTKYSCCNHLPDHLQYHSSWDWLMPVCIKLDMKFVSTDIVLTFKDVINQIRILVKN